MRVLIIAALAAAATAQSGFLGGGGGDDSTTAIFACQERLTGCAQHWNNEAACEGLTGCVWGTDGCYNSSDTGMPGGPDDDDLSPLDDDVEGMGMGTMGMGGNTDNENCGQYEAASACDADGNCHWSDGATAVDVIAEAFCDTMPCEQRDQSACSGFCVWAQGQCAVEEAPGLGSGDTDDTLSNELDDDELGDNTGCVAIDSENECSGACIWDTGATEDAPAADDTTDGDDTGMDIDPFCRTRSCFDTDTEAACVGNCTWDAENDMCNDDFGGLPGGSGGFDSPGGSGNDDIGGEDFCFTIQGQGACASNASCVWNAEETFEDPLGGDTTTRAYCSERGCRDEDSESSCEAADGCEWDEELDGCDDGFGGPDGEECPGSGNGGPDGDLDDNAGAIGDDEAESPGGDVDDDDFSNDGDDVVGEGGGLDGCNRFSQAQCIYPCNWTVVPDMEMPGSGLDNDFVDPCAEEEDEGFCLNTTLRGELEDNDGSGEDDDTVDPGTGSGGSGGLATGEDDTAEESVCFSIATASACRDNAECAWGGMSSPDDEAGANDGVGAGDDDSCRPKTCDDRDTQETCTEPLCAWDQDDQSCSFPDGPGTPGSGDLPGEGSGDLPDAGGGGGDTDGCYGTESVNACNNNENCTWGSTEDASDDEFAAGDDTITNEASCGPRPCGERRQSTCYAPMCEWSGSTCQFSGGGGGLPGSGADGSGSGGLPDTDTGGGPEDPCLRIQSQSACSSGDCIWREQDEDAGSLDDNVGLPGASGMCTAIQCFDFAEPNLCNAYGDDSCFWVVARDGTPANCAENIVSFQPDRSRCFRIRDQSTCLGTTGCIYDTVTSRGHCRGPCHTQTGSACSVGCIADRGIGGVEGEDASTCISVDEAECNAFAEGSCPAERCEFRATTFSCPFSECGRGSPCAADHVCRTGGFDSEACCNAMQAYCQVSGDPACWSDQAKDDILARFSCTITGGDDSGGSSGNDESPCYSDRDGALYDESACTALDGCTFRSFEGSGAIPDMVGFCDEIGCQDFSLDQAACVARENCVFKSDGNECVYEEGELGGDEDGSGEDDNEDHDDGGSGGVHYQDSCNDLESNECASNPACVMLTQDYQGSGGSPQAFCIEIGCNSQQSESNCTSYSDPSSHDDGCEWTGDGFCIRIESNMGSGSGGGEDPNSCWAQQNHNQANCESNSCHWVQDPESSTGGYCTQFSCDNMQSSTDCSDNELCNWIEDQGSGSGAYCSAIAGDGGTGESCNTEQQSECGEGCTWYEDDQAGYSYCVETACGVIGDESACTSFSENCRWVVSTYTGAQCIDTNGNDAGEEFDDVDLTPFAIQCERFADEERCSQYSFCEYVSGGPGCKALNLQCEIDANIACFEYDIIDECNAATGCNFVQEGQDFVCAEITTTARPTLPSYGEICPSGTSFVTSRQFYPPLFLGRLGLFACGEVYSVGPAYDTIGAVQPVLEQECCRAPTTVAPRAPTNAAPTYPDGTAPPTLPPTRPQPTQPPVTSSPTVGPTVNGGMTLDIIFDTVPFATMNAQERFYFSHGVQNELTHQTNIDYSSVLRVELAANNAGGVVATVIFDNSVNDVAVLAAHTNLGANPIGVPVGAVTYRSESSVPQVDATRDPTPAPTTQAPTPTPTNSPSPPPTGQDDGDVEGSAAAEKEDLGQNTMIIIIAIAVLVAALIGFGIWSRSRHRAPASMIPQRATHANPVYAKGAPAPPGQGKVGGSGLVRVESMC